MPHRRGHPRGQNNMNGRPVRNGNGNGMRGGSMPRSQQAVPHSHNVGELQTHRHSVYMQDGIQYQTGEAMNMNNNFYSGYTPGQGYTGMMTGEAGEHGGHFGPGNTMRGQARGGNPNNGRNMQMGSGGRNMNMRMGGRNMNTRMGGRKSRSNGGY
jgi:hypothetical protein